MTQSIFGIPPRFDDVISIVKFCVSQNKLEGKVYHKDLIVNLLELAGLPADKISEGFHEIDYRTMNSLLEIIHERYKTKSVIDDQYYRPHVIEKEKDNVIKFESYKNR